MDTFGIEFTPKKLEEFKKAMTTADPNDKDPMFEFEGKRWLMSYANYLVEYLRGVFFTGRTVYKSDD